MLAKTFLSIAIGAGLASAVSLSDSCMSSVKGLLSNPDAACMNPTALLQLAVNQDVPATVNNWLTGFCAGGTCSNEAIAKVVQNVTQGCQQDLSNIGITASQGDITTTVTNIVQKAFPTARKIACLKDTSKNQLCPVEMITNLEGIIGKLGVDDLSWFNLVQDAKTLLTSDKTKTDLACSQCVKSAFSIAKQDFGDVLSSSDVTKPLTDVCGADFVSGNGGDLGSNINQTANTASFAAQTTPNSASPLGRASFGLVAVGLVFGYLI